jgi:hypothetical protein
MTQSLASQETLDKMPADFVAPLVGHLCCEELEESGATFVAGFGQYHQVNLYRSAGATFDKTPTLEELASRWSEVIDFSAPRSGRHGFSS